jgi:Helix-turn-helix domain
MAELRALRDLIERPRSPWMDTNGVAEYLRLSPKSIQNMTAPSATNPIPHHRINGVGEKRFHADEVDAWLRLRADAVSLTSTQTGRHRSHGPPPDTEGMSFDARREH